MPKNTISINVTLDENKIPEKIEWSASPSGKEIRNKTKAILLSFWDSEDKSALRLDLWTKDMMVDEMADFFFQVLTTMGDTFKRSNPQTTLDKDLKTFGQAFHKKFIEENKEK